MIHFRNEKLNITINIMLPDENYLDSATYKQLLYLLHTDIFAGRYFAIMPDCHAGMGSVIGLTYKIKDIVIPNLVGVDIGCGVLTANIGNIDIDFKKLDNEIRNKIPLGQNIHSKIRQWIKREEVERITEMMFPNDKHTQDKRLFRYLGSIGTLGGGNHFISIEKDINTDDNHILIHSGSRKFGYDIARYYQKQAISIKNKYKLNIPDELAYINLEDTDYIRDMKIAQEFAKYNRHIMLNEILSILNITEVKVFDTIHNYIDDKMYLRKGAVNADKDKKLIIPLNMRDGSLIAIGKGNSKWNNSAPHGAGRIMSRSEAKRNIHIKDYEQQMKDIFTTSVSEGTLDEAPDAYKNADLIKNEIEETADIIAHLKPIYNIKG